MDDERIDFSSLDLSRDAARYGALVARVVSRARRSRSLAVELAAWARPALATTAGCALLVWALVFLGKSGDEPGARPLLSHWSSDVSGAEDPVLGGYDVEPN